MEKWEIYSREANTQIEFAIRSWVAFLEAEKREEVIEIFLHLQHFLSHAAIVDKILSPSRSTEREKILSRHVNYDGIDLKPFRKLRNHLEHFDERLDQWVSGFHGQTFFDMNVITGADGFPQKAFLRVLDAHIFKFHGEDYNLDQLYESLLAIQQRLPS